jgi:magnesium transporter
VRITRYLADRVDDDPPLPLEQLLTQADGALWVDMSGPAADDVRVLRDTFTFHPLAIEDTMRQRQRPKLDAYEGHVFITMHAVHARDRDAHLAPDQPAGPPGASRKRSAPAATGLGLDEIDIFLGPRYVVTIHPRPVPALEEARSRLAHAPPQLRSQADYILYTIMDTAVDTYFPVIDQLDATISRLEDQLFRRPSPRTLDHLFALKRTLLQVRRVAAPLRDLLNGLTRRDLTLIQPHTVVYFRDIYDHLLRVTDMVDTHRDLISGALDIYLSLTSNRLNEVVKVLTVITAVFASLTVITGVYGMNFERAFPPFDWRHGFLAVLVGMFVVAVVMLAAFRKQGWL